MKGLVKGWMVIMACIWPLSFSRAEAPEMKMEEIVVSGSRVEEAVKNVPKAVVVIGEKEMAASSARNVGELLRESGWVDVSGYGYLGAAQSASIRGSSASQVLVMIDGRPINSITYGSADLSEIPLEQVERIEIVKGPGSHLYGANALGGVIHVITKRPSDKPSFQAGLTYGSFNTFTARAEHGQTLDRFAYILNTAYKTSDGHRDNSAYEEKEVSAKVFYRLGDRSEVSLRSAFHQDGLGVPGPVPAPGTTPLFGNEKVTSLFDHQDNTLFNNRLEWFGEPTKDLQVRWQAYQDYRDMLYRQRYQGFPSAVEDRSTYRADIYGTSMDLVWSFHQDHRLSLGGEVRNEKLKAEQQLKDLSTSQVTTTRWEPDNTISALFLQEHWQALPRLRLVGGLRYDHTSRYGSEWSPDLGAVFSLQELTQIKVHYGQAFRPPTFNDLFWPGYGNPNLSPERGTTYECLFDHALKDKRLAVNAGLFYTAIKDKIQWMPDASGMWRPQNVNEQKNWGFETGLKWSPMKDLTLTLAYTYLKAEQNNRELVNALTNETQLVERRALGVPEHQAKLGVAYTLPCGTRLFLNLRYVGDRVIYYDDYDNYPLVRKQEKRIGDYYTLDFKASRLFAKHWEVFVSFLNLTDQKYLEQGGTAYSDQGYPAPGRSITAGISAKF